MNKKLILLVSVFASIHSAHAGFICQMTCSGKVDQVIEGTYKKDPGYAQFEARCRSNGGTVKSGGTGDTYGFDAMGCWLPDSYKYDGYTYCVVEQKVEATGFGLTAIPASGGGHFTASDSASISCGRNLGRTVCGDRDGAFVQAHDVVDGEMVCREIKG